MWSGIDIVAMLSLLTLSTMGHQYEVYLDPKGRFRFQWSVDYHREMVEVRLSARATDRSWFAVGFSDYGNVTLADLLVLWTDKEKKYHTVDAHTDKHGTLEADHQQDYHVTAVTSTRGGGVVLSFKRRFDTCDTEDYTLDRGTTHILYIEAPPGWEEGESPLGKRITEFPSGLQRVQLLKPEVPPQILPADTWTFEIRAPQILVPAKETTYWWHTTILPNIPEKHHIIRYEGVIGEGSHDLVHHMEVFHCPLDKGSSIPYFSGPGLGEGKPHGLEVCREVIGAWAMGAEVTCPVPIFVSRDGRMDTSGIRFYVTSQLRPQEAGIMELGLEYTNKMAIPPGQRRFQLTGYCVHDCTRLGLPPGGIRVFASQLHTHLTGRRVVTRHVRRGRELRVLNEDKHYSQHFQEIRRLQPPVAVYPGDDLLTTCEYDTTSRPNVTVDPSQSLSEDPDIPHKLEGSIPDQV
ncbi:dopamine beta-hydroxylase-like [Aplysia californica]|uniref:Dopamine beta-hydroxylase-like n=1 Tax=Aplysia californica TaxID=6500 RepID=A0ABM1VTV5_APLCA|nr:dopamine beta-hydroxylase-like [Aplysia californica]